MNRITLIFDRTIGAIIDLWEREPVAVTGVTTALLDVLIASNAPITPELKTAVVALVTAIGILIGRNQVTPV